MYNKTNCLTKTCADCLKSCMVGKSFYWGDKLYTCSANPKRHKAISANDCNQFKCSSKDGYLLCSGCKAGK